MLNEQIENEIQKEDEELLAAAKARMNVVEEIQVLEKEDEDRAKMHITSTVDTDSAEEIKKKIVDVKQKEIVDRVQNSKNVQKKAQVKKENVVEEFQTSMREYRDFIKEYRELLHSLKPE